MGSLLVALRNAANAMQVFERGMSVVQSNVTNASTPGYARQTQMFESMPFEPNAGLVGGVRSGGVLDSRDQYAESSVRRRLSYSGEAEQRSTLLSKVEPVLTISAESGVGAALNQMYQAFSALTVTPNDTSARQVALDRAKSLALSFNTTAAGLAELDTSAAKAFEDGVRQLNTAVGDVASLNAQFRTDYRAQQDAGLQARMANALEKVSDLADVTVLRESDGSATIYLGGQKLLLSGDHQYELTAETGGGVSKLVDENGQDVAGMLQQGRLKAAVQFRNETLVSYRTELDELAKGFADTVNSYLATGVDANGATPQQTLFAYDPALGAARTLTVNNLSPAELALADSSKPGGNGIALQLAALDQSRVLGGFTFSQAYANLTARAGRDISVAGQDSSTNEGLLAQVRDLRDQVQSVSLDQEAVRLIEYQRAYQASAQMIRTINDMTETLLNLIR